MSGVSQHWFSPDSVEALGEPIIIASVSGGFTVEFQQREVWLACVASDFNGEQFRIGITSRAIDALMQCLAAGRDALLDQSAR